MSFTKKEKEGFISEYGNADHFLGFIELKKYRLSQDCNGRSKIKSEAILDANTALVLFGMSQKRSSSS